MTARNFSNVATEATLTGSIVAGTSSFALSSYAGFPAVPYTAVIDRGTASEEIILVTGVVGSTVTVTRGYDTTTATSHAAGARFLHVTVAKDYVEANTHVNATTGVHGVTGAVVGTTDVQTLTNKTLTAPILATPSWTGAATGASLTLSGTLVAGATTLTTLALSGALTGTTGSFSGTVTGATATLAGHLVRKDQLDAVVTAYQGADTTLSGRVTTAENTLAAATASATASTLAKRDANGRLQVATPAAGPDAATMAYVDAAIAALTAKTKVVAVNVATDASGQFTVTHGFGSAPTAVLIGARFSGANDTAYCAVTAITSTTFTGRAYYNGSPHASQASVAIFWVALA